MLKEEAGERKTVSTKALFDFHAKWRAMKQYLAVNIFTNMEDVVGLENMREI